MMPTTMFQRLIFACLALTLPIASLQAQMGGGDPTEEIKEIARNIDKQLKEIDELLRESGRKGQTRTKPKELLEKASESSLTVQDGIDKLIEKLNEMKQQGGKGQPSQDPQDSQDSQSGQQGEQRQDNPQDGQQPQGQQQRRENEGPQFVQQPGEGQKPGEQNQPAGQEPQNQQANGRQDQPLNGKDSSAPGQNAPGKNQPNSPTGPGKPGTGAAGWGDLQPYLNFLRNRGASPKVPQKFRKYYEAYLKNKAKGSKK